MLQLAQGLFNVGCGSDGRENLVQYATYFDVAQFLLFIVTFHEFAALVALPELRFVLEGL